MQVNGCTCATGKPQPGESMHCDSCVRVVKQESAEVCRYHGQPSGCTNRNGCTRAHPTPGEAGVRCTGVCPGLVTCTGGHAPGSAAVPEKEQAEVCRYHSQPSGCKDRANCTRAHPEKGKPGIKCRYGRNCRKFGTCPGGHPPRSMNGSKPAVVFVSGAVNCNE